MWLERVSNKFKRVVDFWLDNITARFITEFAKYKMNSYTISERDFLRGPRGRYVKSLYTLIKIFSHGKGIMTME
jgi:hypothetical protein